MSFISSLYFPCFSFSDLDFDSRFSSLVEGSEDLLLLLNFAACLDRSPSCSCAQHSQDRSSSSAPPLSLPDALRPVAGRTSHPDSIHRRTALLLHPGDARLPSLSRPLQPSCSAESGRRRGGRDFEDGFAGKRRLC